MAGAGVDGQVTESHEDHAKEPRLSPVAKGSH